MNLWFTRVCVTWSAVWAAFGAGAALRGDGIVWLHWAIAGGQVLLGAVNVFMLLRRKRRLR